LEKINRTLANSELTEQDTIEYGRKLKNQQRKLGWHAQIDLSPGLRRIGGRIF